MSERERLDALISAAMDDELSAEERAELDGLLADDEANAARAQQLAGVDVALRELAGAASEGRAEGSPEAPDREAGERLDIVYERLRAQLASSAEAAESKHPEAPRSPSTPPAGRRVRRSSWALPLGLAAAAALVVYLLLPDDGSEPGDPAGLVEASEEHLDAIDYVIYSEEIEGFGPISGEDLEIIEQLELLDYLVARDAEASG